MKHCLGKERIQTPNSVPLNARELQEEKSLEKKFIQVGWNLQGKCGGTRSKPKVRNKLDESSELCGSSWEWDW